MIPTPGGIDVLSLLNLLIHRIAEYMNLAILGKQGIPMTLAHLLLITINDKHPSGPEDSPHHVFPHLF
jgi:hypothetical protein